jgi:5-methylcytosine-specific restriction enzyme A
MPRAPKECPYNGCETRITSGRYCAEHSNNWKQSPSGWVKPPGWDRTRRQILERDQGICHLCHQPGADTVDHLRPKSRGGSDHPNNLAAVHDSHPPHCHRAKTNRDRATYR